MNLEQLFERILREDDWEEIKDDYISDFNELDNETKEKVIKRHGPKNLQQYANRHGLGAENLYFCKWCGRPFEKWLENDESGYHGYCKLCHDATFEDEKWWMSGAGAYQERRYEKRGRPRKGFM